MAVWCNLALVKTMIKAYALTVRFGGEPMTKAEELKNKGTAMIGLSRSTIGKTQARQNFLPLVEELQEKCLAVEITDHDKPVAILLSYNHWIAIMSKLAILSKAEKMVAVPNLLGSVAIVGDLDAGSKKAAKQFTISLKKTAENL